MECGNNKRIIDLSDSTQYPANVFVDLNCIFALGDDLLAIRTLSTFRLILSLSASPSKSYICVVSFAGGGSNASPGEISLAHNGVLYLDEVLQYPSGLLDLLRQPLEERTITISRAKYKVTYPASFMLVGSMNPCPCGYAGDPSGKCSCTPGMIARYQARLSGPLLDRIDLNIMVRPLDTDSMFSNELSESSETIAARVIKARNVQLERFKGRGIYSNAQMSPSDLTLYCQLDDQGTEYLKKASVRYGFSARGYSRILKVSRTIADMANEKNIKIEHISEALQYRFQDFD